MKFSYPGKIILPLFALCFIFFMGCSKTDELLEPIKPPLETPPVALDGVKVAATVTGSVIDENNQPVTNAIVTAGTATTTTDAMGNFSFRNIVLSVLNGSVTVTKAGYFKGIRNFVTEEGKNNYVKIQLIKQTLTGTIASASGGTITTKNATITFPANAFVTSSGTPYTGNVNVYATWIDPTAANLPLVVPGDLRGLNSSNGEYILKSYGMVGAELKDDNGNALKIAPGKTAAISFPIPTSLDATAPATIPLWHFDETTSRWREEGTATKNGSTYKAQVSKFSFWNCDVPVNFVYLDLRLVNSANNLPLANTLVKITSLVTNAYFYDHTNDSGFVGGYIPKNETLKLEVIGTTCNSNTVFYTQNIGPYTTNTSLGNINVTLPVNQVVNFTGTVIGCNNLPVSNGYISLSLANGFGAIAYVNANGAVNFSVINCGGAATYNYNAVDLSNNNYSNTATGTTVGSNVNLGTIVACGNIINLDGVYIAGSIDNRAVLWRDAVPTFLTPVPTGNKTAYAKRVMVYNTDVYVLGVEEDSTIANGQTSTIKLWKNGVATNITSGLTKAYGYGFDIYNNNIYIVGQEYNGTYWVGKVWVNGVASDLSMGNFENIDVTNIKVINGIVYVSGTGSFVALGVVRAVYWKNGFINTLPGFGYSSYSFGTGVFLDGNDLYFSGTDSSRAVYWKNGVKTVLATQATYTSSETNSIFIENNNIYIVGSLDYSNQPVQYRNAVYWKNNVLTFLTNNTTTNYFAKMYDIFVKNDVVYSVGYVEAAGNASYLYFRNTIPVQLGGINNPQDVHLGGIFVQ